MNLLGANNIPGVCVECTQDIHCKTGAADTLSSPLGLCTPDGTCTCWVDDAAPKEDCGSNTCPSGFACVQDLDGENHWACLRSCNAASTPVAGMACEDRLLLNGVKVLVWAPKTTCYAFDKFGIDYTNDMNMCSVDGIGGLADGECLNSSGTCTYLCFDTSTGSAYETWCPSEDCDTAHNYCVPL